MTKPTEKRLYRIQFLNQGKVYEVYARKVAQGGILGFVEIEELVFGERSLVVVDPSEEKLKNEFAGVKRTQIPMHSIIRIDEVERQGTGKITEAKGNVTPFPLYYTPGSDGG